MYRNAKPAFNKQAKYEAFLDNQDARQRVVWFSHLPSIMEELIKAINQTKASLSEKVDSLSKFEERSLPKFAPCTANSALCLRLPNMIVMPRFVLGSWLVTW